MTFIAPTLASNAFRIIGTDGRSLLEIKFDGTVTGEIEDAGAAAKVFANELRKQLRLPTVTTELCEALEQIAAGVDGASAAKIARRAVAKARGGQ